MTRWWSVEAAKVWLVVGGGGWWSRGGGGEVVVEGTWKLRKPPTSHRDSLVVVEGRWRLRKWAFLTPGERNPDTRGIALSHICVGMPMVMRRVSCVNFGEFYRQCTATDKGYLITPWHPEAGKPYLFMLNSSALWKATLHSLISWKSPPLMHERLNSSKLC